MKNYLKIFVFLFLLLLVSGCSKLKVKKNLKIEVNSTVKYSDLIEQNDKITLINGDDLVETILMRLSRGSSFKGYGGFSKITKTKDYTIVRPLIYLTFLKYPINTLNQVHKNKLKQHNPYHKYLDF